MPIPASARLYSDICLDVYYAPGNIHRPVFSGAAQRQTAWELDFKSAFANAGNFELLGLAAYQTSSETVVAFDGWEDGGILLNQITEKASAIGLALGTQTLFLHMAISFAYYVAAASGKTPEQLTYVGHSQGGGIAAGVAAYFGTDAYVFNPATTTGWTSDLLTGDRVVVNGTGGSEVLSLPINYAGADPEDPEYIEIQSQYEALAIELAELLTLDPNLDASIVSDNLSGSSHIDGIRVSHDLAGSGSFGSAITNIDSFELDFFAGSTYHGMAFMRVVAYLGMDPNDEEQALIEALHDELDGLAELFVDDTLFAYVPGEEDVHPESHNSALGTSTVFLTELIDNANSDGTALELLKSDLIEILESARDGQAEVAAFLPGLAALALQRSNGNLISDTQEQLFKADHKAFEVDLSTLPLVVDETVGINEARGAAEIISSARDLAGFEAAESGLPVDAAGTLAGLLNASVLHAGQFAGIVVAHVDGMRNVSAVETEKAMGSLFVGLNGNDTGVGGDHDDAFLGMNGINQFAGGEGNDVLVGGDDKDMLAGGQGNDIIVGGKGNDVLEGNEGKDFVAGGEGNDIVRGGSEVDSLYGGIGKDLLIGDDGADELRGGSGQDVLIGGEGDDKLYGDDDNEIDILTGGTGVDEFYVKDGDIITDFDVGDKIYVNGVLVTGAENFVPFYEDGVDVSGIKLRFATADGLALETFEATGGGFAIMSGSMNAPILVFGPNSALGEDEEIEHTVTGEEDRAPNEGHDDTVELHQFVNADGSVTLTDWWGRDDAGQWNGEFGSVPGNAEEAYGWQKNGVPGTYDAEGNWSFVTDAQKNLNEYGYSFDTHTWNEENLLAIWGAVTGGNSQESGSHQDADAPDHSNNNGSPSAPGAPAQQAASAVGSAGSLITPLVLDLDGDGIELTSLAKSHAYFDLDANSFAQRTGWVKGGDGLLAIDGNQNGQIDDINELFGAPEPYGKATTNGFDALAALDSNSDGKIDSSDTEFGDIKVWVDADEDGITDSGELKALSEVGIESISLSATENVSQNEGNTISHTAEFTKTGGGTGTVADVWFANSTLETYDIRSATVDAAIMALPALRGYGEVAGLRLTMSRDSILFEQVRELAFLGGIPSDLLARIENIALQWMIGDAEITDRGENIDATHLIAMERFTGQSFFQSTGPEGPNPGPNAAAALDAAWSDLVLAIGARILVQSLLKPAFAGVTYDWSTDSFEGTLDAADAVTALATLAPAGTGADAYAFWKVAIATLDEVADDLGIAQGGYDSDLADAMSNAGFELTLAQLRDANVHQVAGGSMVIAEEDAIIFGSADADDIRAAGGDDTIVGGAGNDSLNGQGGSDIYVFDKDGGYDVVSDVDSDPLATDTLLLSTGIAPADVLIAREGDDLVIRVAGTDSKTVIEGQFLDSDHGIEQIKFANGTVWNRAFIEALPILGTGGDDTLAGTDNNDFIDGGAGADEMTGGKGSDTYAVDDEGDVVTEAADEGTDLVQSSISYTLGANVEQLILTTGDIDGTGNALDNVLVGTWGANVLDGGEGADLLIGNDGGDTFIVDNVKDRVVGWGIVQSSVSWSLADGGGDQLVLTGTDDIDGSATANINSDLIGNSGKNHLSGNSGHDQLDGGEGNDTLDGGEGDDILTGGLGVDTMSGAAGNDVYWVDDVNDQVIEEVKKGLDVVHSFVDFTLSANVEDLILLDDAIVGTGNAQKNEIVGNDADNVLDGAGGNDALYGDEGNDVLDGGLGNDYLVGGDGNDTYIIEGAVDSVLELGDGIDLVLSAATYALTSTVENLTLTGATDISGTGNALANVLTGGSGANTLEGVNGNDTLNGADGNDSLIGGAGNDSLDGGAGADTMAGGLGNDTYVVDDAADVIVEAVGEGTDVVQSSAATYTLSVNVESLILTGTSNINGTGSSGANTITGNAGDNVLDGAGGNDTLEGGDGSDSYVFGYGSGQDQVKDTVGGATPVDILSLAAGVDVEDVNVSKSGTSLFIRLAGSNDRVEVVNYFSGGGNGIDKIQSDGGTSWDRTFIDSLFITGTAGNNTLAGTANNDWINGNGGTDQMSGGAGSDTYFVDSTTDSVVEIVNEGYDVIESSITIATLANNVEGLVLTTGNIHGTGNGLDNRIIGSSGNNSLNGGAGNDLLIGGGGNDTYFIDSTGDQIIEHAGEGTVDQVQSSVDYTLSDNVENLTLTTSANLNGTGNSAANTITGNAGANTLTGLEGDDALEGAGGVDTLIGGLGNDTYTVDNTSEVVTEADGEGIDLVKAGATFTLSAYVDNLTLTGSSGFTGTGNALDNAITGNTGANQLIGDAGNDTLSGGSGVDTMTGGTGNDIYVVDGATEQVIENADEGIDLVQSSASFSLVTAANVENLTLTGSSLNGDGNTLDNVITGNSNVNQLTGGDGNDTLDGGSNADKLTGGLGNDTYVVDNLSDQVIENAGEGTDLVKSSVNYTLAADLENLTLTGSAANGTGNDVDNMIIGNSSANTLLGGLGNDAINGDSGNDTLNGQGGIDTLTGGNGNDILTWDADDTLIGGANRDTALIGGAGTVDLDTAKVSGIEVVNLGVADDNDNGIVLSLADVLDLASTGSGSFNANGDTLDLVIYGDNASGVRDSVDLTGGWQAAGTFSTSVLTGSSITFDVYQAGGVQVAVQQGLDLAVA